MTIAMGVFTNKAFAIAPGLGLNAVVAFGLVAGAGLGFPEAMGRSSSWRALVTALVLTGVREKIMSAIPLELKKAIAIGIGLFIAFIGLYNSGIVVRGSPRRRWTGRFTTWPIAIALFGLVVTIVLRAIRFRGDLLLGILATTAFATIVNWATDYAVYSTPGSEGWARWPSDIFQSPNFSSSGSSASTPSRRSGSSRPSSGSSRSSSQTSSTRWGPSSASVSRRAT